MGSLVLLFHPFLSHIQGLPESVVLFMGIANLVYGSYSLFVTTRDPRPVVLVKILALANMAWLIVCLALVFYWSDAVSVVGVLLVMGEGVYVASLGWTEWKWRVALADNSGR